MGILKMIRRRASRSHSSEVEVVPEVKVAEVDFAEVEESTQQTNTTESNEKIGPQSPEVIEIDTTDSDENMHPRIQAVATIRKTRASEAVMVAELDKVHGRHVTFNQSVMRYSAPNHNVLGEVHCDNEDPMLEEISTFLLDCEFDIEEHTTLKAILHNCRHEYYKYVVDVYEAAQARPECVRADFYTAVIRRRMFPHNDYE
eukprot:Clim_evm15s211 gene=Clim_evmTU15s211